jgi:hypothetical protein
MMRAVVVVWGCFLARALFYCSAVPMWEGFDEYAHFAMLQRIALRAGLPELKTAVISRQVAASLQLVPVSTLVADRDREWLTFEEYWKLSPEERTRRSRELRNLPADWAAHKSNPPLRNWEAQQAPLYYWLLTPVYWAVRGLDLPAQVWILRCFAALLASVVVPCTFLAARGFFGDRAAIGAAAMVAMMPELFLSACHVSNEALAIAMGAVVVMLGVTRPGVWFGIALGAALLTKAYFLAVIPWAVWVLVRRCGVRRAAIALAACVAISAWWYARTWALTGTITGEQHDILASRMSMWSAIVQMPWRGTIDFVAVSFIWLGGWSFLAVRRWMYWIVEALLLVAAVRIRRQMIPLAALIACLLGAMAYHALAGFRSINDPGTMGYYLYALVVAEAIVIIAGLGRWTAVLAFAFLGIEMFGTWAYLLPFYAGAIRHDATMHLPAAHWSQIGFAWFENLAGNKPFGAGALIAITILYIGTSAALAVVSVRSTLEAARRGAKLRA